MIRNCQAAYHVRDDVYKKTVFLITLLSMCSGKGTFMNIWQELQLAGEGLVQQGLFQFVEGSEFALVD